MVTVAESEPQHLRVWRYAAVLALVAAAGVAGEFVFRTLPVARSPGWFGIPSEPVGAVLLDGAPLLMLAGAIVVLFRTMLGGALALAGAIWWTFVLILAGAFNLNSAIPLILGFAGAIGAMVLAETRSKDDPRMFYRQSLSTRVTHWVWAICLFFLLLTGLQIFNAHPTLYIGQQSGFAFDNAILRLQPENVEGQGVRGITTVFGAKFDTTGVLGLSYRNARPDYQAFPSWATIPAHRDLATGRVVHFFFGWIFVATILAWFVFSFFNGHLKRDVVMRGADFKGLPRDIADHATFKFHHTRTYSPLQRLAYSVVFFILFPLIIITGLGMSPGMDSAWPWLVDMWGGRQTARTVHFITMVLLVLFFIVHIAMVLLAGPFNELRSMITGWYRTSKPETVEQGK